MHAMDPAAECRPLGWKWYDGLFQGYAQGPKSLVKHLGSAGITIPHPWAKSPMRVHQESGRLPATAPKAPRGVGAPHAGRGRPE